MSDNDTIDFIIAQFKNVPSLYIADGHHRAASAVKVGLRRREQNPNYTGDEEFNFFLSVIFPSDELRILDYNRVIKDLNGLSDEEFLLELRHKFDIEKHGKMSTVLKGRIPSVCICRVNGMLSSLNLK